MLGEVLYAVSGAGRETRERSAAYHKRSLDNVATGKSKQERPLGCLPPEYLPLHFNNAYTDHYFESFFQIQLFFVGKRVGHLAFRAVSFDGDGY